MSVERRTAVIERGRPLTERDRSELEVRKDLLKNLAEVLSPGKVYCLSITDVSTPVLGRPEVYAYTVEVRVQEG